LCICLAIVFIVPFSVFLIEEIDNTLVSTNDVWRFMPFGYNTIKSLAIDENSANILVASLRFHEIKRYNYDNHKYMNSIKINGIPEQIFANKDSFSVLYISDNITKATLESFNKKNDQMIYKQSIRLCWDAVLRVSSIKCNSNNGFILHDKGNSPYIYDGTKITPLFTTPEMLDVMSEIKKNMMVKTNDFFLWDACLNNDSFLISHNFFSVYEYSKASHSIVSFYLTQKKISKIIYLKDHMMAIFFYDKTFSVLNKQGDTWNEKISVDLDINLGIIEYCVANNTIIACDRNNQVFFVNMSFDPVGNVSYKKKDIFKLKNNESPTCIAISNNGDLCAIGTVRGTVYIWCACPKDLKYIEKCVRELNSR
jgi:hypothetical protein